MGLGDRPRTTCSQQDDAQVNGADTPWPPAQLRECWNFSRINKKENESENFKLILRSFLVNSASFIKKSSQP